jgi:hypothetical protein
VGELKEEPQTPELGVRATISLDAVCVRRNVAISAHADFISNDQYQNIPGLIRAEG